MLRPLKSSQKHRRKYVLRPLQQYGDQALDKATRKYENIVLMGDKYKHQKLQSSKN